jgi:hypothetical protein
VHIGCTRSNKFHPESQTASRRHPVRSQITALRSQQVDVDVGGRRLEGVDVAGDLLEAARALHGALAARDDAWRGVDYGGWVAGGLR